MTDDNISASEPALDPTSWLAQEQAFAKLCESIRPENKAAVFDALAQAGITSVEVTFDGYADSGQIEDVAAKAGDKEVALPAVNVDLVFCHRHMSPWAFMWKRRTNDGFCQGEGGMHMTESEH